MSKPEVQIIPKSVLEKVEMLRKKRDIELNGGQCVIAKSGRNTGWTWAQQILDAEDAQINEQKLIDNE